MVDIIEEYKKIHESQPKVMTGSVVSKRMKSKVGMFFKTFKPKTTLDYGCGKGWQWTKDKLHQEFNAPLPYMYDPGVSGIDQKPHGLTFDCTICTDVMEHVEPEDCDSTLTEIFNYTNKAVLFSIACNPAWKTFPDGRNLHVNCKPEEWWFATIKRLKPAHLYVWLYFPSFNGVIKFDPNR